MNWEMVAFASLGVLILASGFRVITTPRIVHAALYLALCFTGVAGVFLLLGADFLAAAQVLIYVGAVTTLIIFAIMLSSPPEVRGEPADSSDPGGGKTAGGSVPGGGETPGGPVPGGGETGRGSGPAPGDEAPGGGPRAGWAQSERGWVGVLAALAALGFVAAMGAVYRAAGLPAQGATLGRTTAPLGRQIFTAYAIPFEVASVVLLAALVGAIYLSVRVPPRPSGGTSVSGPSHTRAGGETPGEGEGGVSRGTP
ncbi:MAG: NADH-quinone oxidoreductase subunit J [Bacillota bacterium]|nr:NADH-quinone oxidoreductase subunit J [Bacillota bacterium]